VSDYVVDIKRSARKRNGAVGSLVNRRGTRRHFETREDAESWARGLSVEGDARVWVRSANPEDTTGADAYLVARRDRRDLDLEWAPDKRRRRLREVTVDQRGLACFEQ
jgi:hypothetical protein